MSNYDAHLKIFREIRMHPWIPEHKQFIDSELAKMFVVDPTEAEHFKIQYDAKMQRYRDEHPEEFLEVPKAVEEIQEETPVISEEVPVIKKAKRGRKPKISSPS